MTAFFLEATFLGVFVFGRERVSDRLYFLSSVFVGGYLVLPSLYTYAVGRLVRRGPEGGDSDESERLSEYDRPPAPAATEASEDDRSVPLEAVGLLALRPAMRDALVAPLPWRSSAARSRSASATSSQSAGTAPTPRSARQAD